MWQAWVNLVVSAWVLLSGLIGCLQENVNLIICGIILAVCGFWTCKKWQAIVIGILGVWLFISGLTSIKAPVNFILVGIAGIIFALLSAPKKKEKPTT